MSNSTHGLVCPYCKTEVPSSASVCSGCGAQKGTLSQTLEPIVALFRIGFWLNSIGLVLVVWFFGAQQVFTNMKSSPFLRWPSTIGWLIAGYVVYKAATWIWRKVFGSLSDPRWIPSR